jgi:quercetin dioxygenase-like cupin family protein
MRIVSGGNRASTYGGRFTGMVELEMLSEAPDASQPDVALGHFNDGAVTNWHQHPGGQTLYVVAGTGRVGNDEDGAVELAAGTLVVTPPNERHWHGAAPGGDAKILSFTWGATSWEELPGG